jgi:hypothetical protein
LQIGGKTYNNLNTLERRWTPMSRKQKQKQKQQNVSEKDAGNSYEIMDFLNLNVNGLIWCRTCKHVYMSDDWIMNDFNCPTKGCDPKRKIVVPWNFIKGDHRNKNLPDKPEIGKFQNAHI